MSTVRRLAKTVRQELSHINKLKLSAVSVPRDFTRLVVRLRALHARSTVILQNGEATSRTARASLNMNPR